jgi:hypothetical protein
MMIPIIFVYPHTWLAASAWAAPHRRFVRLDLPTLGSPTASKKKKDN